jgi:hypothetical protein
MDAGPEIGPTDPTGRSGARDHRPFKDLARGDRNITFGFASVKCWRRLTRGASNMIEALASKTCTPRRGGIPPLTREQAELFHAQAPDWQLSEEAHRFRAELPVSQLVNSRKLKAIIRISASVGATRRSLCRPRRSRDCMRTTSSWPPRLTAYSLERPRRDVRTGPSLQLPHCSTYSNRAQRFNFVPRPTRRVKRAAQELMPPLRLTN